MGFADAGRTKDEDILGVRHKVPSGELADQALVDRGLEFEVELVERLDGRKVRDLQSHRGARPLLGLDLLPEYGVEEVEIRRRLARRVIEQRVDTCRSQRPALQRRLG